MKNIRAITYPKSGQHLLYETLLKYFSGQVDYNISPRRDNGGQILRAKKFVFCERDLHCFKTPCPEPDTNFQVMHNCFILPEQAPTVNYLFLYRNPIYSILSLTGYGYPERCPQSEGWTEIDYIKRYVQRIAEWKKWIHCWVIDNKQPNTFLVKYEDLIAIPEKEFTRIIKYIEPDEEVDREHLKEVIKFMDIKPKHKVTDFTYYESMKKTLMQLERLIASELDALNIPRIRWE